MDKNKIPEMNDIWVIRDVMDIWETNINMVEKINECTTKTHFIWSTIPSSDPETSYAVSTGEDTSI